MADSDVELYERGTEDGRRCDTVDGRAVDIYTRRVTVRVHRLDERSCVNFAVDTKLHERRCEAARTPSPSPLRQAPTCTSRHVARVEKISAFQL